MTLTLWLSARCASAKTSPKPTALPPLHASGTAIVDDKGQPVVLRGCNLGNWLINELWMMEMWRLDDPKDHWQVEELLQQRFGAAEQARLLELYRENWIKPRDFDIVKSWGFNVVRLPFYYGLLEDDAAPGQLRPDAFQWLDRAIALTSRQPPALTLPEYPVVSGPAPQDRSPDNWESIDIGEPLVKGGQRVLAKDRTSLTARAIEFKRKARRQLD